MNEMVQIGLILFWSTIFLNHSFAYDHGSWVQKISTSCEKRNTSICTIEIWLAHKHKKNKRQIRQRLKESSMKVIRNTVQFWRPKGGHPPANIAIGSAVTAKDARFVIDLALELNDNIEYLVLQRLNPPNYVAIATSAWDEKSLISITPDNLKRLRDPGLSTEEFHRLYLDLTGEEKIKQEFY